jgi:cytochrome c
MLYGGASLAYADDVSDGKNIFIRSCIGCHAFACNKEGPKLGGLLGRTAAGVEDYGYYSQELKSYGAVWSDETLDEFFRTPAQFTSTSAMIDNAKIDDAEERRKLIAFLKTEDPNVNICPQ